MAFFTLRLSDDLADRFDAAARSTGGRSATLRALIVAACGEPASTPAPPTTEPAGDVRRIELRFREPEIAALDRLAAERGMRRTDWIVALVRARFGDRARPPVDVQSGLIDIARQLKRIGINLNQTVHAVNSAAMEGSRLDLAREAARVATFRDEILEQRAAVRRALDGDLAYWSDAP